MKKITQKERTVYKSILKEDYYKSKTKDESSVYELINGTKVINDLKNKTITLVKKDGVLVINSLLPEGVRFKFNKTCQEYRIFKKIVAYSKILDEADLLGLLHEIGHAWDCAKNFDLYIEDKDENYFFRERNAWAWALKQMKKLRDEGYVSKEITNEKLINMAKAFLYTYASEWKSKGKSYTGFLKKRLTSKD